MIFLELKPNLCCAIFSELSVTIISLCSASNYAINFNLLLSIDKLFWCCMKKNINQDKLK